jgi:hypothetical protein
MIKLSPDSETTASVLFTCANANQVANALPVAEQLLRYRVHCHLLLLDPVYHQNAGLALEQSPHARSVTSVEAPKRSLSQPFAKLPMHRRWAAVRQVREELVAAAGKHDGVVLGMDGAFERLVLQAYRSRRRFSAILWDGLIAARPRPLRLADTPAAPHEVIWQIGRWSRFRGRRIVLRAAAALGRGALVPGLAGHSPVDVMYTMGRFVTDAFRSQGVTTRIETTGIPRFAELAPTRSSVVSQPRDIVYLTGSFLWHDERELHDCQQRDLDALARALPGAGWRLRIRLHPREDPADYARFQASPGVQVTSRVESPLWEELAQAAVVVTAMSTAALEALALGRPIAVFMHTFPRGLVETTLGAHPAIPVARSTTELLRVIESLNCSQNHQGWRAVLEDFVSPTTPQSAALIAESVSRGLGMVEPVAPV